MNYRYWPKLATCLVVLALAAWGIVATCNAGGAGKWDVELNQYFRDADLVILPDQDPQSRNPTGALLFHPDGHPRFAGQDHGKDVAAKLGDFGAGRAARRLSVR